MRPAWPITDNYGLAFKIRSERVRPMILTSATSARIRTRFRTAAAAERAVWRLAEQIVAHHRGLPNGSRGAALKSGLAKTSIAVRQVADHKTFRLRFLRKGVKLVTRKRR